MTDVSPLASHEEISRLKAELELLTSTATDAVYRLRYDAMRYDYVSPSITRLLGFTPEEFKALQLRALIIETRLVADAIQPVDSFEPLERSRRRGEVLKWQADYLMKTKDGRKAWIADVSYPWFDANGTIIGSIGTLRDISDRVAAEEKVKEQLKRYRQEDADTKLAARPLFFDRLNEELQRIKRNRSDLAVLIAALDVASVTGTQDTGQWKAVLAESAKLIRGTLRGTDFLARTGEGDIAAILPDTSAEGAYRAAERLRDAILKHMFYADNGQLLGVHVTQGLAGARFDDNQDAAQLYTTAESRLMVSRQALLLQPTADAPVSVH